MGSIESMAGDDSSTDQSCGWFCDKLSSGIDHLDLGWLVGSVLVHERTEIGEKGGVTRDECCWLVGWISLMNHQ